MVYTFLKCLLISGAALTIDFDNSLTSKRIMEYRHQKNIDLNCLTCNFYQRFFTHKKHPVGASIHRSKDLFPVKPSLVFI